MKNWIPLQPVESSRIEAIGYEEHTQTLAIQFKPTKTGKSSIYHYDGVEPQTWEAFRSAESIGSFFGKVIAKSDVYPFTKCDEEPTPESIIALTQREILVHAPEPISIEKKGDAFLNRMVAAAQKAVSSLGITVVRSPFEYERVDQFIKNVKKMWKEVEDHRVYQKEDILKAGRKVDASHNPILALLAKAEKDAKQLQINYEMEQQRLADESRKQAEAVANKERERLEAIARIERDKADGIAAGLRQKAEAERKKGNEAKANVLTGQARTVVLESEEKAEEVMVEASKIFAKPVPLEIPIIQGNSTRKVCKARVVDATQIPAMFKLVSQQLLDDHAKRTKGEIPIPGVEFYWEYTKASRST